VPIYAPGVTLGISRKMKQELERTVDNHLNRPMKWTRCRDNRNLRALVRFRRLIGVYQALHSGSRNPRYPADLAGACSRGKFVVLMAGEAYDARVRGPNRKFGLKGRTA
jgi:hypothetical protein